MTAYIIMTSANAFTDMCTTNYDKATKTVEDLNNAAKKANNGMRFWIKAVPIDAEDYDTIATWFKNLF